MIDSELDVNQEIVAWVKQQPYWVQYTSRLILNDKNIELAVIFKYFLEEHKLSKPAESKPEAVLIDKVATDKGNSRVYLKRLEEVVANALATNQKIEFSKNLTVIYGNNGSGKTGYIRLLNNSFISRGDMEILPNVFKDTSIEPHGKFTFTSEDSEEFVLEFPNDKADGRFDCFSVFDNKSVRVHLDDKNQLTFKPQGLDYFEKLATVFSEIKVLAEENLKKYNDEIDFSIHFSGDSEVKTFIIGIKATTTDEELKKYEITNIEKDKAKSLEKEKQILVALDIKRKLDELEVVKKGILQAQQILIQAKINLNLQVRNNIKVLIRSIKNNKSLLLKRGVQDFKNKDIDGVGNEKWKNFLVAGQDFIKRNGYVYPKVGDPCIFCWQPLSPESVKLVERYWELLSNALETKLKYDETILKNLELELQALDTVLVSEGTVVYKWLEDNDKAILVKLIKYSKLLSRLKIQLLANINVGDWTKTSRLYKRFYNLNKSVIKIQTEIDKLTKADKTKEIENINTTLETLKNKQIYSDLLQQIKLHLRNLRISNNFRNGIKELDTTKITLKHSELYRKLVDQKYKDIFNAECTLLDAGFGIAINQSGDKGKSYRQLQICGRQPDKVLSEGEQKVTSIADFVTENTLCPNNYGMIFDDPVTSLDLERKEKIATRLTDLSELKQVIIFTHDPIFLFFLRKKAELRKIDTSFHWIKKINGIPGIIANNDGPGDESRYKNSDEVSVLYNQSLTVNGSENEKIIKDGFSLLRTCYEHLIVNELFNKVVKRWEERISIDSLKNVIVTPAITIEICETYSRLSEYIEGHLHSDDTVGNTPESSNLKAEIEKFNALKGTIKLLKK
ncbi:MAG: hypothetical protein WCV93_04565 [Candidatus Shapirobacteria bacterium]